MKRTKSNPRPRKFKDVYVIVGRSSYGKEDIDEFETLEEARKMIKEYRMAMPTFSLNIVKRKEPLEIRQNPDIITDTQTILEVTPERKEKIEEEIVRIKKRIRKTRLHSRSKTKYEDIYHDEKYLQELNNALNEGYLDTKMIPLEENLISEFFTVSKGGHLRVRPNPRYVFDIDYKGKTIRVADESRSLEKAHDNAFKYADKYFNLKTNEEREQVEIREVPPYIRELMHKREDKSSFAKAEKILARFIKDCGGREYAAKEISKKVVGELEEFRARGLDGYMAYGNREALFFIDGEEEPFVLNVDYYGDRPVMVWG